MDTFNDVILDRIEYDRINSDDAVRITALRSYIETHVFSFTVWYYGTVYFTKYDFSNGFNPINAGEFKTEIEAMEAVALAIYKDTCRFCKHFDEENEKCVKDNDYVSEDDHYNCIEK